MALDNLMNTLWGGATAPSPKIGGLGMPIPPMAPVDPVAPVTPLNPDTEKWELATPDDYASFAEEMNNIDSKVNKIQSDMSLSDEDLTNFKEDLIKDTLFQMESLGVDLTDPDSVSEFLTELEWRSPDLYDYVSYVFSLVDNQDELEKLTQEVQTWEENKEDMEDEEGINKSFKDIGNLPMPDIWLETMSQSSTAPITPTPSKLPNFTGSLGMWAM